VTTTHVYPDRIFILYDGRAKYGDTDDAICMDTAMSEEEAAELSQGMWADHDAIWYETKLVGDQKNPLYEEVGPRHDLCTGLL
jgi:hypothetical protein